jgi:hypothetical protein
VNKFLFLTSAAAFVLLGMAPAQSMEPTRCNDAVTLCRHISFCLHVKLDENSQNLRSAINNNLGSLIHDYTQICQNGEPDGGESFRIASSSCDPNHDWIVVGRGAWNMDCGDLPPPGPAPIDLFPGPQRCVVPTGPSCPAQGSSGTPCTCPDGQVGIIQ